MSKKDFLLLNESKQFALNKPFKVLSEHVISYKELVAKYKGDKLYANELASLFLLRNRKALRFLGIVEGVSSESGIRLITSRYVGCVPLVSPKTGLPGGFIQVVGNFGEDISELLSVIDGTLKGNPQQARLAFEMLGENKQELNINGALPVVIHDDI